MSERALTLYLWDLANTLFPEKWDQEKSGFLNYDEYVKSLGYNLQTISPKDYEWSYEIPYRTGLFDLSVADGFKEVLTWTKNNAVFTTGNKEQLDWRAEQLKQKYHLDIRDFLKEIYSTFDFGNTNIKTPEMLKNILKQKYQQGFNAFVYTDDNLENCKFFINAAKNLQKELPDLTSRVYQMRNDKEGLRPKTSYYEIGSLYDMMGNEKTIRKV